MQSMTWCSFEQHSPSVPLSLPKTKLGLAHLDHVWWGAAIGLQQAEQVCRHRAPQVGRNFNGCDGAQHLEEGEDQERMR